MAGLTLDAGALIAADRNDRRFWRFWKDALRREVEVTVPAAVLAQSWRSGRNARMATVLRACVIEPLDASLAKRTGRVCGISNTSDIADAALIVSAAARHDDVLTSDPDDIRRLAVHCPGVGAIVDLASASELGGRPARG